MDQTSVGQKMAAATKTLQQEDMNSRVGRRFRRHPGAVAGFIILSLLILAAIAAPLSPYDPEKSNIAERFRSPSLQHPMGTDGLGRDLLTRVLYGARISLTVGVGTALIALVVGTLYGLVSGFKGGS